jgi:LuxR family quorum-sensing system transcriptional regulator CciR
MRISEFIERSNQVASTSDLFALLVTASAARGFDRLAYGTLSGELSSRPAEGRAPAVALNYPSDWVEHYFDHGYQAIDPVVCYTPVMPAPYAWVELGRRFSLDRVETRVMEEAQEVGLRAGVSVPLHGPWGSVRVVSFASTTGVPDPIRQLGSLQAIAAQFSITYADLTEARPRSSWLSQFSEREKECLSWAARGKSSWDIGMILGVSEFTVNFHLRKAMRKLETGNRVVAVVKAIRFGVIHV